MIAQCNGVDIAFDDYHGIGHPVLFIHGHPFNRSMWQPQVNALRGKHRVITPDLRGYGDSGRSSESATTLETFAADLVALLDYLQIAQACIVGLSMGGQVAMEFARAYPERTSSVVLAATFARAETTEGVEARNRMADLLLSEGMAVPGCEMLPKLVGKTSMKAMPEIAADVYRMIASTDPHGAASALRGRAMRRDYSGFLSTIRVPTLVVVGTEDAFTTVDEAADMHHRISRSRLEVFENVGHMPNLEDAPRFNEALRNLLSHVCT